MFVTYLTIYDGDKLPPFYIGSTSAERLTRGYCGSVSSQRWGAIWREELKANPQLFETVKLSEHETRRDALEEEQKLQEFFNAPASPLFVNMAYANGGFINPGKWSEAVKAKIRASQLGHPVSSETRAKLALKASAAHKGRKQTPEQVAKRVASRRATLNARNQLGV